MELSDLDLNIIHLFLGPRPDNPEADRPFVKNLYERVELERARRLVKKHVGVY